MPGYNCAAECIYRTIIVTLKKTRTLIDNYIYFCNSFHAIFSAFFDILREILDFYLYTCYNVIVLNFSISTINTFQKGNNDMIDESSPVSKYYQLKDILAKNIQDGKWPPQSRISSENELCEAYNVSRVTVRKAIDLLVQEGYLYTIKGKGTYVKGKYIEQPLTHFYSFREDLRGRGVSTYSTMRYFGIIPADVSLAADLNIQQDERVFCIERIFFAGEQPYAREFSYIPCAICPELHAQQVQSLGLYNSLKKYNIIPTRASEKLKAILLDQETAAMLDQEQNDAAIYLTRITYHNNVVIEKNISYVRGDMFVYSVELSAR